MEWREEWRILVKKNRRQYFLSPNLLQIINIQNIAPDCVIVSFYTIDICATVWSK